MTDDGDRDGVSTGTDGFHTDGPGPATQLEAIPNEESDTITFVPDGSGTDEVATAWLTVETGLVVDVSEVR